MTERVLLINGPFPSKKQRLTPRKNPAGGKGFFYNDAIRGAIDAVTWQFKEQWKGAPAVSRAGLQFCFMTPVDNADSDSWVTLLLDCMQTAGVLVNDNTKHLRDWSVGVFGGDFERLQCQIVIKGGIPMERKGKKWVEVKERK